MREDGHKILLVLMLQGRFSTWMPDPHMFTTCRTDGLKPVVYRVEGLDQW
jgi:uncharacterized repeat protein (TIGR04076 family)